MGTREAVYIRWANVSLYRFNCALEVFFIFIKQKIAAYDSRITNALSACEPFE